MAKKDDKSAGDIVVGGLIGTGVVVGGGVASQFAAAGVRRFGGDRLAEMEGAIGPDGKPTIGAHLTTAAVEVGAPVGVIAAAAYFGAIGLPVAGLLGAGVGASYVMSRFLGPLVQRGVESIEGTPGGYSQRRVMRSRILAEAAALPPGGFSQAPVKPVPFSTASPGGFSQASVRAPAGGYRKMA